MKKIKTFVVMMMVAVIGLFSSFEASAYDAKACSMVANKNSACNQGSEPFYVFIKKFKTNKKFMKSRVKSCKKKNFKHFILVEGIIDGYDDFFHEFKAYKYKKEWRKSDRFEAGGYNATSSATWEDVSKNMVKYVFDEDNEICGWGFWYIFERINGKWYLTHYVALP